MPIWNEELQQWGYLYHEEVPHYEWLGIDRSTYPMDILNSLRYGNQTQAKEAVDTRNSLGGTFRPQTITELLDAQIAFYETKIADLKAAKEAISPEVEKALNALAKIS